MEQVYKFEIHGMVFENVGTGGVHTASPTIPFITKAKTYEEARTKALNFGQDIVKGYNETGYTMFFRLVKG